MAFEELRGKIAVVGADECDEIGEVPNKSTLHLQAEAIRNALRDAGLSLSDVDGLFTAGTSVAVLAEYLGIMPRYYDGTSVGGCSFLVHVEHAMLALYHGLCDVAVISHGESGRSRVGGFRAAAGPALPAGQFEAPFGTFGPTTLFSIPILRYMKEYGRAREEFAEVAVNTRKWASLNPRAMMRDPITVEDVLNSRLVCYPLTLFMCCLVTDAAGALVLVRADRAKDVRRDPVYILGSGEGMEHQQVAQMRDFTVSRAYQMAGARAFEMAGVKQEEIDFLELYDAFVHTPVYALEALGFAKRGEALDLIMSGRMAPGGDLPLNTNGGGLSYTHSGMYGMFALVEGIRQLRGQRGEGQVPNAQIGLCHGVGGMFSASATVIFTNQEP